MAIAPDWSLLRPRLTPLAEGVPAIATFRAGVVGAATGVLTANWNEAAQRKANGEQVVFLIEDYRPEHIYQIGGMDGVVIKGKSSSHLAIMCQNAGIPAVIGFADGTLPIGAPVTISITKDGKGQLSEGTQTIVQPDMQHFAALIQDAMQSTKNAIRIYCNASSAKEMETAITLGAAGCGLVRTEHFLRTQKDLAAIQTLLTEDASSPNWSGALAALGENQYQEALALFKTAESLKPGFPIQMRLIDPPYDELLNPEMQESFAQRPEDEWRGIQLLERMEGIGETQVREILRAAKDAGYTGKLSMIVPHTEHPDELQRMRDIARQQSNGLLPKNLSFIAAVESRQGAKRSGAIAGKCDGILFAYNDLTAEVTGCSRDDAAGVLAWMEKQKSPDNPTPSNPFKSLSPEVRTITRTAVADARKTNPSITFSTPSGQVAGDKSSIEFCTNMGFSAVSVPATPAHVAQTFFLSAEAKIASAAHEAQIREVIVQELFSCLTGDGKPGGMPMNGRLADLLQADFSLVLEKIDFKHTKEIEQEPILSLWAINCNNFDAGFYLLHALTVRMGESVDNQRNEHLNGPMHWAALNGGLAYTRSLHHAGGSYHIENIFGTTPAMDAAKHGHAPILADIFADDAPRALNARNRFGFDVLQRVAAYPSLAAAELALREVAKLPNKDELLNRTSGAYYTPLDVISHRLQSITTRNFKNRDELIATYSAMEEKFEQAGARHGSVYLAQTPDQRAQYDPTQAAVRDNLLVTLRDKGITLDSYARNPQNTLFV